jgi:cytochrome c2
MTQTFALLALAAGFIVAAVMPVRATAHAVKNAIEITGHFAAHTATKELVLTPEALEVFLILPLEGSIGAGIEFAGLRMEEKRADQIAYLATFAASGD